MLFSHETTRSISSRLLVNLAFCPHFVHKWNEKVLFMFGFHPSVSIHANFNALLQRHLIPTSTTYSAACKTIAQLLR